MNQYHSRSAKTIATRKILNVLALHPLNRFEKRQAKNLAQRKERDRIADQLPAAPVSSQWILIEREFLRRPPYLPAYQAASLIERGKPLYENREGFTQIFT